MPSLLTLDGAAVLSGRIVLPRRGAWSANLIVDATTAPTGMVTLSANDGAWTMACTAVRSGVVLDTLQVRVVGGRAGMTTTATARTYRDAVARVPLGDLLEDAGETLAADSDETVTGTLLAAWMTAEAPIGPQVARLIDTVAAGAVWRYDATGAVWCGVDAWSVADAPGELIQSDEAAACDLYGVEYPSMLPAVKVGGRLVSRVEYEIASGSIRARLYYEVSDADRGAGLFARMVRQSVGQHVAGAVDYLAGYEGVVTAQSADGTTVDVNFDDARLESPTAVKIVVGIPGATFKVVAGCRVLVKWIGGDPRLPYVSEWRLGATVTEMIINGTLVYLGGATGAQFVALANLVKIELDAISSALSAHTHAYITPLHAGPAGVTGTSNVYVAGAVAASQVKAV